MSKVRSVAEGLLDIRGRMEAAAGRAGRDLSGITLVAVSKGQPPDKIREALAAGQRDFGENYLAEAIPKLQAVGGMARWHMIGHIQSRKAQGVVENFIAAHSVDSLALSQRLSRMAMERNRRLQIFLECNVSGEESKFGFPAADRTRWGELLPVWREIRDLPGCRVAGLMTMAPFADDPERSRPFFRTLRELAAFCAREMPGEEFPGLSMGMSDDFEIAIEEGATVIRVGRAIFGPRGG